MIFSKITGFDFDFPAEYLKAALLVSLLSVWVLVGLFFYLNLYTRRQYFTLWTAAWLFYAIWLSLCISVQSDHTAPLLMMLKQWCVSASAVCLLWGSSVFHRLRPKQTTFGLFILFLFVWSYLGAFHLEDSVLAELPIFVLIGLASLMTAYAFYRFRVSRQFVGAGLLSVGFFFWGLYMGSYPLLQDSEHMVSSTFLISAVLQLFIAVSMIILVLEEVRITSRQALEHLREERGEKITLQQRIISAEERFRSLFEQAHEGIILAAAGDLQIIEMNPTAQRLLGLGANTAAPLDLQRFFPAPAEAEAATRTGAGWFDWVRQQSPLHLVRPDGALVPVEIDGAEVSLGGRLAYQFFLREQTERTRLEQQLRQAEKLSAIGQMISGVAHELNNPLAVVLGYLELILARHELGEQTRADLEKVVQEANRAAKLVGNFLYFAREKPVRRERTRFNDLVRRVVELREPEIKATGIEVRLELDPDLPATEADPDQVQQVLVILVNNALQAMLDQPAPGRLTLSTRQAGDRLEVRVADNGPGVPPHLVRKIFEPFFTTKQVGTGTGLGLSIAHGIMVEHQGRIWYETVPGGGACFVLEFPVRTPPPDPAQPTPDSSEGPAVASPLEPAARPPARILVLDDEPAIGALVGEMLGVLGHKPRVCHAGSEALAALERDEFDVVLSDYRMPGMDGQEFYRLAVERRPELRARIIFVTGDTVNEETRAFFHSVGAPSLSKPFHLDDLEQAIGAALQNQADAVCVG